MADLINNVISLKANATPTKYDSNGEGRFVLYEGNGYINNITISADNDKTNEQRKVELYLKNSSTPFISLNVTPSTLPTVGYKSKSNIYFEGGIEAKTGNATSYGVDESTENTLSWYTFDNATSALISIDLISDATAASYVTGTLAGLTNGYYGLANKVLYATLGGALDGMCNSGAVDFWFKMDADQADITSNILYIGEYLNTDTPCWFAASCFLTIRHYRTLGLTTTLLLTMGDGVGNVNWSVGTGVATDDVWRHVCAIWSTTPWSNGKQVRFYVDGELIADDVINGVPSEFQGYMYVMSASYDVSPSTVITPSGAIQNLRLWNYSNPLYVLNQYSATPLGNPQSGVDITIKVE